MDESGVLIVGAGPVGLVAALSLATEGIPVTVLESHPDLPEDLRASTLHPPTLDMLDRFGISERCIENGLICPHWQFRDRNEGAVATFDLGMLAGATAHPYRVQCEQWKLTRYLREKLSAIPGAEIRYNMHATGATQDDDGVTLSIETPDGAAETLRARYLIAADGARSTVRKSLGVAFDGITIPEVFLSLSTTHEFGEAIPDLASIAYISDPSEWLVLLRTPTLWRVLLPTDAGRSDEEIKAPETVERRLQKVQACPTPYEVVHKTAYRVHERVADHYIVGRAFLAGDAAHVNNPLGGMGMNGGIHDAVNLTERLAAVYRGAALETLGRYERQRRKVALETVQASTLRNRRNLNETDPEKRRAVHDELRRTVADPELHRAYVMRSSMIQSLRDLEDVA
jgi:3-(3-hydroxy-phenyl)propionate hydroxylase